MMKLRNDVNDKFWNKWMINIFNGETKEGGNYWMVILTNDEIREWWN